MTLSQCATARMFGASRIGARATSTGAGNRRVTRSAPNVLLLPTRCAASLYFGVAALTAPLVESVQYTLFGPTAMPNGPSWATARVAGAPPSSATFITVPKPTS